MRIQEQDQLEKLMDIYSLAEVVSNLQTICHEKAEHLRTNWNDEAAAKDWDRGAAILGTTETKLINLRAVGI